MDRNALIYLAIALAVVIIGLLLALVLIQPVSVTTPDTERAGSAAQEAAPAEQAAVSIAGAWQSTDDTRFVRTFRNDGTVIDRYAGDEDVTTSGTWNFVEDPSKEQAELPDIAGATYLKLSFMEEVLYFTVLELSATDLSLSYVGRGNTLSFTRVD